MEESELEVGYSKNHSRCSDHLDSFVIENNSSVNRIKRLVQSLKSDDVRDGLQAFSHAFQAYSSDFLNLECMEIFMDALIARARKEVTKNFFNLNYFLCVWCGDVLKDPVTLKCGHTFSKKCVLGGTKASLFECLKCGKIYSHSYLSELKTNVVISALLEKFWKNAQVKNTPEFKMESVPNNKCDLHSVIPTNEIDSFQNLDLCNIFMESPSPKDLLRKGDVLVNLKRYKEATQLYLMSSIFDPSGIQAKNKAVEYCSSGQLMDSEEKNNLHIFLHKFCKDAEKLLGETFIKSKLASLHLNKQEFECPLCMRLLWEPITTPCGHTFCRICLYRCFDHQPACPLCKTALNNCLAERVQSTDEFIDLVVSSVFPTDYSVRKNLYIEEMEELSNAGKDRDHVIPLFVCTIAFPTVPCPLHIFEPRYRLMIRQCMESGSRKFGMCAFIDNNISDYGTILEIKDVRYFPDGRSVVDTVGYGRFRILSKGERDGYHTGAVEFLKDEERSGVFLTDLKKQHDRLYKISQGWVMRLPQDTKHQILQHFGPMPRVESNSLTSADGPSWFWWMLAILPVEPRSQVLILSMTSLSERLKALEKILLHLDSTSVS